ncbi:hypothetical protein LOB55_06015 [Lactobacillus delbrueckii subsp. lactis]|jgi:hypothetical protein|uniref:DUF1828 domain-containing protein n=1 Tax=Lactobacillus delbrueckii TaxID=1584 RepID=A0ABD4W3V2_9LACO|nr:hypothetical protein [Lactobacillus delbrueckii]ADQ61435.1 Hypothetical protein LDBND_1405 [Lactobacillus delbrueckii subsp. bulgaricus ND02]MBN6090878.1 hypothetical protein [Lactobacillus delbrueckii subsp. bulgaricus]MBO3082741.1 hypothetical protein [Lactobacillus delbrueckii subsp. bulgaricus]MCD5438488.1 hypothetical protein [Lactobacillus delbrueckii subsp. lactis]MCD5468958.1 hypothetical protein [Lactobacillus delbrueckii subsp. lactis]
MESEKLKADYINWVAGQTVFNPWSDTVVQVENELVDAYGRKPFVLVEKSGDKYMVTDDGYLMYKYNPTEENEDLNEYAAGMVMDAGFDFDEDNAVISQTVSEESLPGAINALMQLEIMISFIA